MTQKRKALTGNLGNLKYERRVIKVYFNFTTRLFVLEFYQLETKPKRQFDATIRGTASAAAEKAEATGS
jgi:hypothetical protein